MENEFQNFDRTMRELLLLADPNALFCVALTGIPVDSFPNLVPILIVIGDSLTGHYRKIPTCIIFVLCSSANRSTNSQPDAGACIFQASDSPKSELSLGPQKIPHSLPRRQQFFRIPRRA